MVDLGSIVGGSSPPVSNFVFFLFYMIFGFLNILLFFILLSFNILVWNEEIVVISLLLISLTLVVVNLSKSLNTSYSYFNTQLITIYKFIFNLFILFAVALQTLFIFIKYIYFIIFANLICYFRETLKNIIIFLKFNKLNFYIWVFLSKSLAMNTLEFNTKKNILGSYKKLNFKLY